MNRRRFLTDSAGIALAPAAVQAQTPPNSRIGVGVIGCGGMGRNDLTDFQKQPEVEIRAVCDAFRPAADQARQLTGGHAEVYSDFRRILDRKDIDAVVIATPITGTRSWP